MRFSLTHTTSSCLCKTFPRALGVGVGVEPEVPSSIAKFEAEAAAAAPTSPPSLSLCLPVAVPTRSRYPRLDTAARNSVCRPPPRVPFPRNFPKPGLRYATDKLTSYTNKNNGGLIPLPRGFVIRRVENPCWVGGDGPLVRVTSSTTPISCLLQISIDGFSKASSGQSRANGSAARSERLERPRVRTPATK